jgi:hypothetical protein
MKIQPTAQQPGKPALRSGAIIGVALGIIHSAIAIIVTRMNAVTPNTVDGRQGMPTIVLSLGLLTPLIWIIGFLITGAWASRETGKISTGVLAGLLASTFAGVIAGIGQVIAMVIASSQQSYVDANLGVLFLNGLSAVFYVMVLPVGAGAGFGALGGLIGQSISNVRPQPIVQPVYAQPVVPYTYVPIQPPQVSLPQPPQTPPLSQFPEQ